MDRLRELIELEAALHQKYDSSHVVTAIEEQPAGDMFPAGTRRWFVEHTIALDRHRPPRHFTSVIYWYQERFTIVTGDEMAHTTLRLLVERVKEKAGTS